MTRDDWIAWTVALTRPEWVDDEEAPRGVRLIPWWSWMRRLSDVPGEVERVQPSRAIRLPEVLYGQHGGPVPGEWCAVDGVCNGACRPRP